MTIPANSVWINTPSTIYGAVSPISLSAGLRKVACFDNISAALEYSGNTPGNTISLVIDWYDHNQDLLFSETLLSDTVAATNLSTVVSIKGAFASLSITGSINPTFNAATQAILKQ